MCVSMVFAVSVTKGRSEELKNRVLELGKTYSYGIGIGEENLNMSAREGILRAVPQEAVLFEVHDLPEPHCACDIEQDIRNNSKLGKLSKFFDFVREINEYYEIESISILFFQDELPCKENIRKQFGTLEDFVQLINRWNTWQVEGFEPTRQSYHIAEATPLLFTFTKHLTTRT